MTPSDHAHYPRHPMQNLGHSYYSYLLSFSDPSKHPTRPHRLFASAPGPRIWTGCESRSHSLDQLRPPLITCAAFSGTSTNSGDFKG